MIIYTLDSPGHSAILHGCTVEDEAFIGMGATVLDGVVVEKHAMVAAGALVRQNTRIPAGEVSEIHCRAVYYNVLCSFIMTVYIKVILVT